MLAVNDLEIRVGARLLMSEVTFRVDRGDKIGLVGRNGAGKTTLTKTLAGQAEAAAGTITRTGEIGYLPQDPRAGNLDDTARTRILEQAETIFGPVAERTDATLTRRFAHWATAFERTLRRGAP